MRKQRLYALLAILIVTVGSLLIAETLLRLFTGYPINQSSNRETNEDLGYTLALDYEEADDLGFRNLDGQQGVILAIGDSHTYGNNVAIQQAWPAVLSELSGLPVYNLGIGSYGILAYHALIELYSRPETKFIIVAVYPANDFIPWSSNCQIIAQPSAFWKNEIKDLGLRWPEPQEGCFRSYDKSIFRWLEENSAFLQMFDELLEALIPQSETTDLYSFDPPLGSIPVESVVAHEKSTKSGEPGVEDLVFDFERFLSKWISLRDQGIRVGILFIPSRERVVYRYYEEMNRLADLPEGFVEAVETQVAFEARLESLVIGSGIDFRFALDDVTEALSQAVDAGLDLFPEGGDSHPLPEGYAAYAASAFKLYQQMKLTP